MRGKITVLALCATFFAHCKQIDLTIPPEVLARANRLIK